MPPLTPIQGHTYDTTSYDLVQMFQTLNTFYTLSIRLTPVNTFSLSTLLALTDNALDTTHQRVTNRSL